MLAASAFTAPWANTTASLPESALNLLGSLTNGSPVSSATWAATLSANPTGAFRPVPTAVPPRARRQRPGSEASSWAIPFSTRPRHPLISSENEMGTASCRWVRPLLSTPAFSTSRRPNVATRRRAAGMSLFRSASTAAMCSAVGNVSLEDWERFTASLGCRRMSSAHSAPQRSTAIWLPRLASTSFMFMFDWVPDPVCQTLRGNSPSWWP